MSHDADKLIRQLSLVAFLMAERRPLTARDVKGNVEGYSEMSDEAFARRFYSDRAELTALGVPLHSQRDEFTGEELYTLRSENYFLDGLELEDDELAALQTALYYARGEVRLRRAAAARAPEPRARPAGFPARAAPTRPSACASRRPTTPPSSRPGCRSSRRRSRSSARSSSATGRRSRDKETERTAQPVRAAARRGRLVRRRPRPRPRRDPDVPRLPHPLATSASRRAASATSGCPRSSTSRRTASRGPGRSATRRARRGSRCRATPPGGSTARSPTPATLEDGVFETSYATLGPLVSLDPAAERPRDPARAGRAPRRGRRRAADAPRRATPAPRPSLRASGASRRVRPRPSDSPPAPSRPSASASSRRSSRTCSPPAATTRRAILDADELAQRFSIPREELQETLSLLNLVNFGGGCYTVYAEVDEETGRVRVDKELYGDVFRKPPKLTPLEARAIRLAIEYVGPTIAADAHTPLDRVRRKLEETFGQFDLAQTPASRAADDEEALVKTLSEGAEKRRLVEIEYLKEGEEEPTTRVVEPYTIERELPFWRVHTWDRTVDGPRTYRLDRMRSAKLTGERFEPRAGLRPELPRRAGRRQALALAGDRPLEARAGRAPAHGQGGAVGGDVQDGGVAPLARCSPTAARRSCSSRRRCAARSSTAPARSRPSSGVSARRRRTAEPA